MNDKLERFYRELPGKRVTVVGIGVSNRPLIRMLAEHGAAVTACDKKERDALGDKAREL